GGAGGDQGNQAGDGGRRKGAAVRYPDDSFRRRDPSLQQGTARRISPARGERQYPPDRGDDGEPVVRNHLGAVVARTRVRTESADGRADCRTASPGAGGFRTRAGRSAYVGGK